MVRPEFANIPIKLPDIPYLYKTNQELSFLIDAILITLFFSLAVTPITVKIIRSKTFGRKLGIILGIILGFSSAFALRQAGITLFEYWFVAVDAA